ncbi:hypothetical protein BB560_002016 [Smittium megazygosporum]|uniref:Carbohydrate-binding module family 19 domain-containing protein n=1 Tax=Smittium megazygosporum TaxID=133381 RepID=A0A2T9ZFZ5_9FUNG|nr:hypothetical protein BB560_002016 [Smittium megazygosporum]
MKFKAIIFAAVAMARANAATCTNEGLERCAAPSGSSSKFIKCENGREVTSYCDGKEKCYGNGISGIMCIDPKDSRPLDKRAAVASPFGGYTTQLNNFLRGINGDAVSLKTFVNSARRGMFTNKNSVIDMSNTFTSGFRRSAADIRRNSKGYFSTFGTNADIQKTINGARTFTRAISGNLGGTSYLLSDFGNNIARSKNARSSISRTIASGSGIVSSASPLNSLRYAESYNALSNLAMVSRLYYPTTLGRILTGTMAPRNIAGYLASANSGNSNGTNALLGTILRRVNRAQPYMPAITSASQRVSISAAGRANTGIVNGIMKRYKSRVTSSANMINVINGAANAIAKSKGKYARDLAAYESTATSAMGDTMAGSVPAEPAVDISADGSTAGLDTDPSLGVDGSINGVDGSLTGTAGGFGIGGGAGGISNIFAPAVGGGCSGCTDSTTLSSLLSYLTMLSFSTLLAPVHSCCGPSGASGAISF